MWKVALARTKTCVNIYVMGTIDLASDVGREHSIT